MRVLYELSGSKMSIQWSQAFLWTDKWGPLLYIVYVGTTQGSADLMPGTYRQIYLKFYN